MGITTTYTCDKCGHSQTQSEQMWYIEIHVNSHYNVRSIADSYAKVKKLWCRKCVEALGFLPAPKDKKNEHVITPPPNFEEMIRDIVREEMTEV